MKSKVARGEGGSTGSSWWVLLLHTAWINDLGLGSSALCHMQRCRRCKTLMWSCTENLIMCKVIQRAMNTHKAVIFLHQQRCCCNLVRGTLCCTLCINLLGQEVMCFGLLCSASQCSSERKMVLLLFVSIQGLFYIQLGSFLFSCWITVESLLSAL